MNVVLALLVWWFIYYYTLPYIVEKAHSDPSGYSVLAHFALTFGHMNDVTVSLLVLPVTRNSIWEALFGVSFERSIKYHRWIARIAFTSICCHVFLWQLTWLTQGTWLNNAIHVNGYWKDEFWPWYSSKLNMVDFYLGLFR